MENVLRINGVTVIELDRAYDASSDDGTTRLESVLKEAVSSANRPLVLLDMSRTASINSTFLGLLFATGKQLRARQGQMALCAPDAFCTDVMRVVKLSEMFNCYATRSEGVEALTGGELEDTE
jgi:anti-anti-sigma factor